MTDARSLFTSGALAFALAAASPVAARTTNYESNFFSQYAPRTALDIARNVPGFSLASGDSDVRGFAGAAGNVVINGARPSSKAETLETTLARIPASRVVRVELGPGDLYGAEYTGKSQVLNVILSGTGGIDGNVTAAARRLYTGYVNTDISASALIRRGDSTVNLSAGTGRNRQVEEGFDDIRLIESGDQLEYRRKFNSYFNRDPYLSGSWALEQAADRAVRVNLRWAPSRFDLTQRNRVTPADGDPHDDSLFQKYRTPVFEVGGDVTRPLAGGAVKLVTLATRRKRNNQDTYLLRSGLREDGAMPVGGFDQRQDARLNETIAKVSWTRSDLFGLSVETGAEGALNTLRNSTELSLIGADGELTPVALPIANATVKETRGELFLNAGRNLLSNLRLDTGLAYEFSRLTVSGDADAERSLRFLKPSVSLDWRPAAGWHGRLSLRRTVAQLNFYDFISAADLSSDRVNAGNADLQPQRAWELRATLERTVLGEGLVKLEIGADRVSALQDIILTEDGFSAPGNLGTGRRRFASLQIDAPLASVGMPGVRVKLSGQFQRTRVRDQISGEDRNWSGFFPDWEWRAELRRDVGAFSYGLTVNDRDRISFFRADEIDSGFNGGPYGTGFVEWRPSARTSVTLDVDNLFDTTGERERLFFDPNRGVPEPVASEYRVRNRQLSFGLTLKQSLGGGDAAKA